MKTFRTLALAVIMIVPGSRVLAQQYNMEPAAYESNMIGIRAGIPMFKEEDEISTLSGMYAFYMLINLKNNWSLYGELPVIIASARGEIESESGLGNLFIEARKALTDAGNSHVSIGTYLPTVGEENFFKQVMGLFSNSYRVGQSISAFTVYGNYSYNNLEEKNEIVGFEVGPEVMFPTVEGSKTEVWTHFGFKAGYKINKVHLWGEFNGQVWLTESELDPSERLFTQLGLAGRLNLGKVNPVAFYGFPLNKEIREIQRGVLGFRIEVMI